MKKLLKFICIFLVVIGLFTFIACQGQPPDRFYAMVRTVNMGKKGVDGIKGTFHIPNIDPGDDCVNNMRFITFEQWLPVNNASKVSMLDEFNDWFELGYVSGYMNSDYQGAANCQGYFKAKRIDGNYWETMIGSGNFYGIAPIFRIANTGSGSNNTWSIFIDNTSYGAFSDNVGVAKERFYMQGYEMCNPDDAPDIRIKSDAAIYDRHYYENGTWMSLLNSPNDATEVQGSIINRISQTNSGYYFYYK